MFARSIRVTGKVQGVFFRAQAKEIADRLNIKGWVRNTDDGSVEILAEGREDSLKEFEVWCAEGPQGALVKEVETRNVEEEGFDSFEARW